MVSYSVVFFDFSPSCRENWRVSNFEIRTAAKTTLYRSCTVDCTPVARKVSEGTPRDQVEKNFALIVKVDLVLSTRNPIGKEQLLHRNSPRFRFFKRYVDSQLHNCLDHAFSSFVYLAQGATYFRGLSCYSVCSLILNIVSL